MTGLRFILAISAVAAIAAGPVAAQQAGNATGRDSADRDAWQRIDIFDGERTVATDDITTGAIIRENELLGYCFNVADLAVEARGSFLKEELATIEADVDRKIEVLDRKIDELQRWYEKRDAFLASANQALVAIYQNMRPDAAAEQLSKLGPALSAAIIAKLEPRVASVILNEMKAEDAAAITAMLASAMEAPREES